MRTAQKPASKTTKKTPSSSAIAVARQAEDSRVEAAHQMMGRSRVSNAASRGSIKWLDRVDKRGPVARRFKDLVALVTADLGGLDQLSEAQRQIIRRIASLSVWCESEEAKMADGEEVNIDRFGRTANTLRRLLESLGLERRAKDITPTLGSILREGIRRDREAADAEVEVA